MGFSLPAWSVPPFVEHPVDHLFASQFAFLLQGNRGAAGLAGYIKNAVVSLLAGGAVFASHL
jgi:hypothetical protein